MAFDKVKKRHVCDKCGADCLRTASGWLCPNNATCGARLLMPRHGDISPEFGHELGPDGGAMVKCSECKGTGKVECGVCDGSGTDECPHCSQEMDCEECGGDGKVPCDECDGTGECEAEATEERFP